jgi:hypothetical protein
MPWVKNAIEKVYPQSEHRECMRYLFSNFKKWRSFQVWTWGRLTLEEIVPGSWPMEIRLVGWRPEYGSHYAPTGYRARIRLRKVPLHLWTPADIHTLVAGFGYPIKIAPFFSNGNYDSLRLLIACGPPPTIPEQLWVTIDPELKIVDVEIEGWLPSAEMGGFPPDEGENPKTKYLLLPPSSSAAHEDPGS